MSNEKRLYKQVKELGHVIDRLAETLEFLGERLDTIEDAVTPMVFGNDHPSSWSYNKNGGLVAVEVKGVTLTEWAD